MSFVGAASLAAAQASLDAEVAAAILAGFVPESIEVLPAIPITGGRVNGLSLEGGAVSAWTGVTAADCVLLQCNGRANVAAIDAAIAAEIAAQDLAGVTPSLRQMKFFSLAIDGVGRRLDVVALLFTDGVAAVMSAADKTKLDGIQKQSATIVVAPVGFDYTVDWALGSTYAMQLAAANPANLLFSNVGDGEVVIVAVDGNNAAALNLPAGVLWAGGVVPTPTLAGVDVYTFAKLGATIVGSVILDVK